ncbi:MAG: tyrosine-type recombinase/integrase [Myxococcota bacterium]
MATRKLKHSWQYDFTIPGYGRRRRAGFHTKAEAREAERQARDDLLHGRKRVLFAEAYALYLSATRMKALSRDHWDRCWPNIEPVLGHLYIEEVDTLAMDRLKQRLPKSLGPSSRNHRLSLVRAVLRFVWKRGLLAAVPYIPMDPVPEPEVQWYTETERDQLLGGMYRLQPRWYAFFYITMRLGLRAGEVYAISRSRVRDIPPQLVIDRAVQRGYKGRPATLGSRKNDKALILSLTQDVVDAIRWHVGQGYAGNEFLFSRDGQFPVHLDSYKRPLRTVQRAMGLRELSHHQIGRHSVASQAATGGQSIKAIQAQLGHRSLQSTEIYAHLGARAQLRLVESLEPAAPPHVNLRSTGSDDEHSQLRNPLK